MDRDMSYSTERARIESALATAHRALWRAAQAAEHEGDESLTYDLRLILGEVQRLAENSLKGKARRSVVARAQLSLENHEGVR